MKTRLDFDYDARFHGHAQNLKVGDIFSHSNEHIWEVIQIPSIFPTSDIFTITAKRLTGTPKIKVFNFGRFVSL